MDLTAPVRRWSQNPSTPDYPPTIGQPRDACATCAAPRPFLLDPPRRGHENRRGIAPMAQNAPKTRMGDEAQTPASKSASRVADNDSEAVVDRVGQRPPRPAPMRATRDDCPDLTRRRGQRGRRNALVSAPTPECTTTRCTADRTIV